ncbi:hypothetical protein OAE61_00880 [Verrucomicrobiales bacterium]|nr:hypothetical protein [Verrucomicrobiales bacterium]MDC0259559.1 hypothetical protein [Verrucomicrobiales bacterium]
MSIYIPAENLSKLEVNDKMTSEQASETFKIHSTRGTALAENEVTMGFAKRVIGAQTAKLEADAATLKAAVFGGANQNIAAQKDILHFAHSVITEEVAEKNEKSEQEDVAEKKPNGAAVNSDDRKQKTPVANVKMGGHRN